MIDASNSSLDQILHEVATDTGTKVQGLDEDQRVFGIYGPGPARDVLFKLLYGSGYNVLMIGGQGDEPPQQIVLSKSVPGGPQVAKANPPQSSEDDQGDEENPAGASGFRPFPGRGGFGATPGRNNPDQVEMQQEMRMREQQVQEQREEQQEPPPQDQPPQDQPQNNPQYY